MELDYQIWHILMFRGERGGDLGVTEGENTTRRKVARTFSDMYTLLHHHHTHNCQVIKTKMLCLSTMWHVTCHEFNYFQPCVTFYQDVKVVRRTYPRREATTQTDETGHGADDSTGQVQPHIPKVGEDNDIETRAVVKLVFKRLKSRPMTPVRKPLGRYFVQSCIPREREIDIESPPMVPVAKPLGRCKVGQF